MYCKRIVYAVEPLQSAILSLVSVDVALGRVFSKAVSSHYVACCHSDALKVGFRFSQEKNVSLKTHRGHSQNNDPTAKGHSCVHIALNLMQRSV